jgi:Caspase domain
MIRKNILVIFVLLVTAIHASTQTIYQAKYNLNTAADTNSYAAFLFKYNDGVNLIRLKYTDPATGNSVVADTETDEFFASGPDGRNDYNTMLIKVMRANDTATKKSLQITLPVFIYKLDNASGFHELKGVCTSELNPVMASSTHFTVEYIAPERVSKDMLFDYFTKTDDFYLGFYGPGVRGGVNLKGYELKIKMHVLLVSDTKDPTRGEHHKSDLLKMTASFDTIRKYIGITDANYNLKIIKDDEVTHSNVNAAINKWLKPGREDIVVFYFFGHGFRKNVKDSFPYINLISLVNITKRTWKADSLKVIDSAIGMQSIFQRIQKKGARLNLVLSDVCNINIGQDPYTTLQPATRGENTWSFNPTSVRELFLSTKRVSVLSNACKNGEASWSTNRLGGFFTNKFNSALQDYSSGKKGMANWKTLMGDVRGRSINLAATTCCQNCERNSTNKVFCKLTPVVYLLPAR